MREVRAFCVVEMLTLLYADLQASACVGHLVSAVVSTSDCGDYGRSDVETLPRYSH